MPALGGEVTTARKLSVLWLDFNVPGVSWLVMLLAAWFLAVL